jgi:hypothetical protein
MKIEIKIWIPATIHFIFRHIEGKIETEVYDGFYYSDGEIKPLRTFKYGESQTSKNIIRRVYKK